MCQAARIPLNLSVHLCRASGDQHRQRNTQKRCRISFLRASLESIQQLAGPNPLLGNCNHPTGCSAVHEAFEGRLTEEIAVLFQLQGPGLHGDEHTFEKPWFTTWESALSCWVSLIIFWTIKLAAKLKSRRSTATADQEQPLLSPSHNISEVSSDFIDLVKTYPLRASDFTESLVLFASRQMARKGACPRY